MSLFLNFLFFLLEGFYISLLIKFVFLFVYVSGTPSSHLVILLYFSLLIPSPVFSVSRNLRYHDWNWKSDSSPRYLPKNSSLLSQTKSSLVKITKQLSSQHSPFPPPSLWSNLRKNYSIYGVGGENPSLIRWPTRCLDRSFVVWRFTSDIMWFHSVSKLHVYVHPSRVDRWLSSTEDTLICNSPLGVSICDRDVSPSTLLSRQTLNNELQRESEMPTFGW